MPKVDEGTPRSYYPTFGECVVRQRNRADMTQRQVADVLGISHTYISKIENGDTEFPPSEKLIRQLADTLNADPEYWLDLAGKVTMRKVYAAVEQHPALGLLLRRIDTLDTLQWGKIETFVREIIGENEE